MRTIVVVLLALFVVGAVGVASGSGMRATNLSALPQPHLAEARLARAVRRFAVPTAMQGSEIQWSHLRRRRRRPCPLCRPLRELSCQRRQRRHRDGAEFIPEGADMRLPATQSLTDGELFWIIEHVRFTGMPGWSTGTKEGEAASWHLVHFIRHLPDITAAELEDMAERNPRSPEEVRQDIEAERFLRGEDVR